MVHVTIGILEVYLPDHYVHPFHNVYAKFQISPDDEIQYNNNVWELSPY